MEHPQDQTLGKHESAPAKEQEPLLELDGTLGAIDNVINDLDGASLTPEQQSRVRKIKGNIIKSTGNFSRVTRRAVAIGMIIGSLGVGVGVGVGVGGWLVKGNVEIIVGHQINQHVLEETTDASGQTIYTHPDRLTTHYLNIIAGRDKFTDEDLKSAHEKYRTARDLNVIAGLEEATEEDAERIERRDLIEILNNDDLPPPANMEEMSFFELVTLDLKHPRRQLDHEGADISALAQKEVMFYIQKSTRELNERAKTRSSMSKDIYDLVWRLEKESGNPRIRLSGNDIPGRSKSTAYFPSTNTVQLEIMDLIVYGTAGEGFISEMSHGKQFNDNLLGSSLRKSRDYLSALLKSKFVVREFSREHDKLYDEPGSLEFQAHKVIQPDLEKRYPLGLYSKQQKDGESK